MEIYYSMFCKKCGHERQEGEKFCPVCGTPFPIDHDEGEPIDPSQKKKEGSGPYPRCAYSCRPEFGKEEKDS